MSSDHAPQTESDERRNEVAIWLAQNDPDPCNPIDYDAAAYYRDFADALLASGWLVTPPVVPASERPGEATD